METVNELPKTYSPENVEQKWYKTWEEGGHFKPKEGKKKKAFCLIMPPPNVTGKLHMGHALDATTQDALTRFKRMSGYKSLWLPGTDHAGIATQAVVEKLIYKETKKTRHEVGRENFLKEIWKWKEEYGNLIVQQQKAIGASADWDYAVFTMDEGPNRAVKRAFKLLFDEGLIYQADYIVNWSPELQSAISDAEVEHKEVKGAFYHIKYKLKDSDEFLEVATTRPETLLGDTAVAVNPNDERFKHLIGKKAIVPLCNREVTIIGDEYVDMEKGTGCLKVTPGHDFNDFEIGKRHNLEIINILNKDCTLNDVFPEFAGMTCKKARVATIEKLKELNLFISEEDLVHQVGHCERSGVIIEPMVSKQWFVNVDQMAAEAVEMIENETTKFFPKGWENTYFAWLRNPKDWCISRQLWWGHRIPIFYCKKCDHKWAVEQDPTECEKCSSSDIFQDPDVLDTWFSSGLWPMSTLGWPDPQAMKEKQYDTFFPTTTLITGYDIIFFWVARMMMMSLKMEKKVPFDDIYIHAIVRDKQGRKMSKSLGNGIDPLDMIKEYGADALRFTLAAGSGYNRNLNLDPARIEGYRNFINKIWNAYRFIAPVLNEAEDQLPSELDNVDKWILTELNEVSEKMNSSMEEYRFDDSCSAIYSFVYEKFCSWFIELSKPILQSDDQPAIKRKASVLQYGFKQIMALLHPFTPFITEELWQHLKSDQDKLLIETDYPQFNSQLNFSQEKLQMGQFIEITTAIRNLRAQAQIKPKEKIKVHLIVKDSQVHQLFSEIKDQFEVSANLESIIITEDADQRPPKSLVAATAYCEVFIPLEGVVDIGDQVKKLEKEVGKLTGELEKLEKKLGNKKFVDNAPQSVVDEVKNKCHAIKEKRSSLEASITMFKG